MADTGNALVLWGSTGRRLQFSVQDLKMPEELRDSPQFHFYEKQWDAVAGFWFNRVLKETSLQHLEVSQIVEHIRDDIAKRWEKRRQEQVLHKKRKRLLQATGGPAGTPARAVLLTNVVSLDMFVAAPEEEKTAVVRAVVDRVAAVSREEVASWRVLVDTTPAATHEGEEPPVKKARAERGGTATATEGATDEATAEASETAPSPSTSVFDDRVAVLCTLSSKEKAALVIAQLHGNKFDGRSVVCRFWAEA